MVDWIAGIFVLLGAGFCVIAAVGMVRLPDLYVRMHAATKAGTLGVGLAMLAVIVFGLVDGDFSAIWRAVAAVWFIFFTAPIGAHLLARAAYATGVEMWHKSGVDDLRGQYDFDRGILGSHTPDSDVPGDDQN